MHIGRSYGVYSFLYWTRHKTNVGFKNVQTYNRTLEAQQILATISVTSHYWGLRPAAALGTVKAAARPALAQQLHPAPQPRQQRLPEAIRTVRRAEGRPEARCRTEFVNQGKARVRPGFSISEPASP
jgi:hypothetical protein